MFYKRIYLKQMFLTGQPAGTNQTPFRILHSWIHNVLSIICTDPCLHLQNRTSDIYLFPLFFYSSVDRYKNGMACGGIDALNRFQIECPWWQKQKQGSGSCCSVKQNQWKAQFHTISKKALQPSPCQALSLLAFTNVSIGLHWTSPLHFHGQESGRSVFTGPGSEQLSGTEKRKQHILHWCPAVWGDFASFLGRD